MSLGKQISWVKTAKACEVRDGDTGQCPTPLWAAGWVGVTLRLATVSLVGSWNERIAVAGRRAKRKQVALSSALWGARSLGRPRSRSVRGWCHAGVVSHPCPCFLCSYLIAE